MANPGEMTSALLRDPRRWAITLGGLALYGLGSRLWLPGLDPGAFQIIISLYDAKSHGV